MGKPVGLKPTWVYLDHKMVVSKMWLILKTNADLELPVELRAPRKIQGTRRGSFADAP